MILDFFEPIQPQTTSIPDNNNNIHVQPDYSNSIPQRQSDPEPIREVISEPSNSIEDLSPSSYPTIEKKIQQSKLEEIICNLSVKQLRTILEKHHIKTSGFFDKSNLQEAVYQFCIKQSMFHKNFIKIINK